MAKVRPEIRGGLAPVQLILKIMELHEESYMRVFCNTCQQKTYHFVSAIHSLNEDREWAILCCEDCYTPQFRWAERDASPPLELYFPPHDVRSLPKWIDELPEHISGLLREIYRALAEDHLWLAAMGTRTLIDMFAVDLVGDVGGFKAKLARLQKDGYLSDREALFVATAVEVGHDATHRSIRPSLDDCQAVLDIVEHLLQRRLVERSANVLSQKRAVPQPSK